MLWMGRELLIEDVSADSLSRALDWLLERQPAKYWQRREFPSESLRVRSGSLHSLKNLLRHAADAGDAGDAKRKRLVLMLARQIAESIGAPAPRFGAAPEALPVPVADLPPPPAATTLGVYFFEQDLDAAGLLGEPTAYRTSPTIFK